MSNRRNWKMFIFFSVGYKQKYYNFNSGINALKLYPAILKRSEPQKNTIYKENRNNLKN